MSLIYEIKEVAMNILKKYRMIIVSLTIFVVTLSVSILTCASITDARTKKLESEINYMIDLISAAKLTQKSGANEVMNTDGIVLYIISEYEGKIGIYDNKDGKLLEVLDRYIYSLPDADKQYLSEGIPVYSFSELLSLVEDYTS